MINVFILTTGLEFSIVQRFNEKSKLILTTIWKNVRGQIGRKALTTRYTKRINNIYTLKKERITKTFFVTVRFLFLCVGHLYF